MNLHFHPIVLRKTDMMITDLLIWRERANEGYHLSVTTIHPQVDIARRPFHTRRIEQRISLPFQHTCSEALPPEPLRNLYSRFVQPCIRFPESLVLSHPLEQQPFIHPHIRRQSLYTIKENAHQTLLPCHCIQHPPVSPLQRRRHLLHRTDAKPQKLKENPLLL